MQTHLQEVPVSNGSQRQIVKLSLTFPICHYFAISVNLTHPSTPLFHLSFYLPLWCLSLQANDYFGAIIHWTYHQWQKKIVISMFLYLNLGRGSVESRTCKTMNRSRRHPLKEITKQHKYEGAQWKVRGGEGRGKLLLKGLGSVPCSFKIFSFWLEFDNESTIQIQAFREKLRKYRTALTSTALFTSDKVRIVTVIRCDWVLPWLKKHKTANMPISWYCYQTTLAEIRPRK